MYPCLCHICRVCVCVSCVRVRVRARVRISHAHESRWLLVCWGGEFALLLPLLLLCCMRLFVCGTHSHHDLLTCTCLLVA